ncbi:MAG: right-handed parallel beta-helix repeat-containing protein [Methanobrevibacter sp.]|nr:right-handed parallel beta-helix repeat-containing protein [Methanobrevibacter sp.]
MGMASASSDLDDHNDTLAVSNEIEIVDDNSENLDNGNAEILGVSSQEKLGSEIEFSGTTVSELVSRINSATAGDTIILTNDLTATSNEARFSKSITIDGNNHIIDANGNTVFYNYQNGIHVVFKNIKFINGKKTDDGIFKCFYPQYDFINCTFENSGPIKLMRSSDGQIINCTFKNCAGSYGGAIYFQGGNNFTIKNCYFENCSAGSGAIIF